MLCPLVPLLLSLSKYMVELEPGKVLHDRRERLFGLKNAGATYQRAMTNIFKELIHHEVECYVDDLVLQLE